MNILITGGASGLGEAITRILAKDITNNILYTYNNSTVNADKISMELPNCKAIKCNFKEESDIVLLVEIIKKMDLDILINNAYCGNFLKSHFQKIAISDFLTDFSMNIIPTIQITQTAITTFRKKKSGKIITVLSSALIGNPPIGSSVYVANKAYMEKLTKVWASENAKYNITSTSVSPSFMQTSMHSDTDGRVIEQIIDNHPLKKLLTIEEVADTVMYLTKASSQLNGIDIVLNSATNLK